MTEEEPIDLVSSDDEEEMETIDLTHPPIDWESFINERNNFMLRTLRRESEQLRIPKETRLMEQLEDYLPLDEHTRLSQMLLRRYPRYENQFILGYVEPRVARLYKVNEENITLNDLRELEEEEEARQLERPNAELQKEILGNKDELAEIIRERNERRKMEKALKDAEQKKESMEFVQKMIKVFENKNQNFKE